MKDATVLGFVISHATATELAAAATGVNRLLANGSLRPRTVERARSPPPPTPTAGWRRASCAADGWSSARTWTTEGKPTWHIC
ncbi:hypothetical protein NKH77_14900 [Streptomyces sp. M19]